MLGKIDEFITNIFEGVFALLVTVILFISILGFTFAIPIFIIVALMRQDWQGVVVGLLCEVGAIFGMKAFARIADKIWHKKNQH